MLAPPPLPVDESERLDALRRLQILDTPPSENLDRIARLAARALRVPIVLVSLVDQDRQWFKASVGLDAAETARDVSFCAHAVFDRKPMVVCDACKDPRFSANPLVIGAPYIRAYVGIPLYTISRQPIGTICAIDRKARMFAEEEIQVLGEYAKLVESELNARDAGPLTQ